MSSVCCVSSVGSCLYARSVAMPIWNQHAYDSGQGRHPWRTGLCLCMLHKNPLPSMVPLPTPHPHPFTLSHPYRTPSPSPILPAPIPLCWLLLLQAYQKYAWRNNGRSMHTKPGMYLNVAGWVPLFSQSMLCVPCFPPRERGRDGESRRGCVNAERRDREVMW